MSEPLNAITRAVLVSRQADSLVSERIAAAQVTLEGFAGDKHAGLTRPADSRAKAFPRGTPIFNDRQVSLVSAEELAEVAEALSIPHIRPEWLGANLLLSGIPALTRLAPGTRLFFAGGAVLYVTRYNNPCTGPGKVIQAHYPHLDGLESTFVKQAMHRRGLVAVVDRPGQITEGDTVTVLPEGRYRYQD